MGRQRFPHPAPGSAPAPGSFQTHGRQAEATEPTTSSEARPMTTGMDTTACAVSTTPASHQLLLLPTPWSPDTKDPAVVAGPPLGVEGNKAEGAGPLPGHADPWTGDGDRPRRTSHVSTTLWRFSVTKLRLNRNERGPSRTGPSHSQGPEGVGADPSLWLLNRAPGPAAESRFPSWEVGTTLGQHEDDIERAPQSRRWGALLPHGPARPLGRPLQQEADAVWPAAVFLPQLMFLPPSPL